MFREHQRTDPRPRIAQVFSSGLDDASGRRPLAYVFIFLLILAAALLPAPSASAALRRAGAGSTEVLVESHAPLPMAREGAAAAGAGTEAFVAGGEARAEVAGVTVGRALVGRVDVLDAKTAAWRTLTDQVIPRRDHGAAVVGRTLILVGGKTAVGPCAAVELVDLDTGAVRRGAPLPTPRARPGVVAWQGQVWVAGGTLGWSKVATVEVYDPKSDAWLKGPSLSEARDPVLVVAAGDVYALGGRTAGGRFSTRVERLDRDGRRWGSVSPMPRPRPGYTAVGLADRAVVASGQSGETWVYDPVVEVWSEHDDGVAPRTGAAAAPVAGRVLVVGGAHRGASVRIVESLRLTTQP